MSLAAIRFLTPGVLALLLLLPVLAYLLRRGGRLRGRRGTFALALRLIVLAALIVGLSRPRIVEEVRELAVVFLLDVSDSIPIHERDAALRRIERYFEELPEGDVASLIVFGDRPSVEVPFRGLGAREGDAGLGARLDNLESRIMLAESDLSRALEFAEGTIPADKAGRIVLISDGNETTGDLQRAARALAAAGVRLDVIPIRYRYSEEVIVEGLRSSGRGRLGEPTQLRAIISSQVATDAELLLQENGVPMGDPILVRLDAGTNVFRFSPIPSDSGYFQYELTVRAARDGNAANNIGRAGVLVGGEPRVLVVADANYDERLAQALAEAGLHVVRQVPRDLPRHPAGYIGTDSVVLQNVAAFQLEEAQQEALRDAVKELGMGLVFVGGAESFGPGGYRGTPLEELLPIDLDTKNKKSLPKGALVIVLHSIEFDSGNTWAIRICKSALKGLTAEDEAGIVYYDGMGGERWLFDLAPLGDKVEQYKLIEGVYVGDMPSFARCFQLAEISLMRSDAAAKHIIVISDGDPQIPSDALIARLVDAYVTISTICISPHGPNSTTTMQSLAQRGSGRYFRLEPARGDLDRLPNIMMKEAATLRRAAIKEEPFTPVTLLPDAPLLRGLGGGWPPLQGYVVTSIKAGTETILLANEEERDPLLAAWHVGLGRCIAFTSDASSRWAKDWLPWSKFGPFWGQLVRSSVIEIESSTARMSLHAEGMGLMVELQASDEDGHPLTDLEVSGTLFGGEGREPTRFDLQQVEVGVYRALIAGEPGHHLVRLDYELEGKPVRELGVCAIDFAPEYRTLRSREEVLVAAAAMTGGRELDELANPFVHDLTAVSGEVEAWPWLVLAAVLLLLLEILSRRLDIALSMPSMSFASEWIARMRERRSVRPATTAVALKEDPGYTPQPTVSLERKTPSKESKASEESAESSVMAELKKAKERAERRREWK